MKVRVWTAAVLAPLSVLFVVATSTPATAQSQDVLGPSVLVQVAAQEMEDIPRSDEVDEDGLPVPAISDELLSRLHEHGLKGSVTSVQHGATGGVFYGGESGTWVIDLAPDASTT